MSVRSVGIVLAAGASRRMGTPKAGLELGGQSFLARAVAALAAGGTDVRVVVTGAARTSVAAALPAGDDVTLLDNPAPDRGQLSSLKIALVHAAATWPEAAVAVVGLVDHPAVRGATVAALLEAARGPAPSAIVVPAYRGKRGHPVAFARAVWPELLGADDARGARSVVRADAERVRVLDLDDPGVLIDVDTPADLQRLLATRAPG